MTVKVLVAAIVLTSCWLPCLSQDSVSFADRIIDFPNKFFKKVTGKAASIESKLDHQTERYLASLLKEEKKLRRKLQRRDSAAASVLNDAELQYARLDSSLRYGSSLLNGRRAPYIAYLDTLKTFLSFLEKNRALLSRSRYISDQLGESLNKVKDLQTGLGQSEQVKAFIRQRKEQLKAVLGRYSKLPGSFSKAYAQFNEKIFYYSQQVQEYRELLKNPDKLTRKGLDMISKTKMFRQFMQEHSELASLFKIPEDYGTPQSLAGLQTLAQVQQVIQTQLSSGGPNVQQMMQLNIQAAHQELNKLKDKLHKLGRASSGDVDADMPDFKPDNQKTKSFLQRLELGTNLQSTKASFFFPTTTDLGLSIGYKLNDKTTIGVGGSYKVGWGKDIRHIEVTSEGAGLRSFLDVKIKGSFYMSGGYEYNYQGFAGADSAGIRQQGNSWTQSGLVGISKIISLKTKFFKKTKMQLLWDFMSYRQMPRTAALKFRVGYSF